MQIAVYRSAGPESVQRSLTQRTKMPKVARILASAWHIGIRLKYSNINSIFVREHVATYCSFCAVYLQS